MSKKVNSLRELKYTSEIKVFVLNMWKYVVLFWNLHRKQKFYTAASSDDIDKFHLWQETAIIFVGWNKNCLFKARKKTL